MTWPNQYARFPDLTAIIKSKKVVVVKLFNFSNPDSVAMPSRF
jgi:hypothetical protein